MAHVRTQIRDALVAALAGLPHTDDRVFPGRLHPLAPEQLPALVVNVDEESIEVITIHGPAQLQRHLTVRVDCVTQLEEGIEDDMDAMALQVEHAIAADATLGGILNGGLMPATVEVDRNGEGEAPVGRLTISFAAQYEVASNAVDTPL